MQRLVQEYVAEHRSYRDIEGRVLEIGSYDVNGTLNEELEGCEHIKMDMREGPNVDVVANAHVLPFPDDSFDAVICVEMLEHDAAFWVTMKEIERVCRVGGAVILCASSIGFGLHDHPCDYWRFTAEGMRELLSFCNQVEAHTDRREVFASGVKSDA